jgi:RNA polymerase sigma factor (sigma-70 family)
MLAMTWQRADGMRGTDTMELGFQSHRTRLRAMAYRMLGSLTDADDAVQETWLRLRRAGPAEIDNMGAWLTTVNARVCLDMLRSRKSRREDPIGVHLPDPVVSPPTGLGPEDEALLADVVGFALLVVLDTLTPAERLSFVLHDVFAVPFDDIAQIMGRSTAAAKKLASRARNRVRDTGPAPDPDLSRQRAVTDAFFAAARRGDFAALLAVLDPDVVVRADAGTGRAGMPQVLRGAHRVAEQALSFARLARSARPALVNGAAGSVVFERDRPFSVMAFTVVGGLIVAIDILADPRRVPHLDLPALDPTGP